MKHDELSRNDLAFLTAMRMYARRVEEAEQSKPEYARQAIEGVKPPKRPWATVPTEQANRVEWCSERTDVYNVHGIKGFNVVIPGATKHSENMAELQEAMLAYARGEDLVLWKLANESRR